MKNKEFYKDEIAEIALERNKIAVDKKTLKPVRCANISCGACLVGERDCAEVIKEWANAEYVEPCEFEKDELVEVSLDGKNWHLRYFSHRTGKTMYAFIEGKKSNETSVAMNYQYLRKYGTLGGLVKGE